MEKQSGVKATGIELKPQEAGNAGIDLSGCKLLAPYGNSGVDAFGRLGAKMGAKVAVKVAVKVGFRNTA
jgi:hypothetical protein